MIPANVPTGVKRVAFMGGQGSFGAAQFVGEGTILNRTQQRVTFVIRRVDPLAQTFRLDTGRFVTAIEFWFTAKGSSSNNVVLEIRETELGLPNMTGLAEGILQGSAITVGAWNKITLTRPVYLEAGLEFAMVLLTDDPTHAVALAELGKFDAVANRLVTSQPYTIGTMLKSSNATTWTPEQAADLAFRIYGASFTSATRTVDLGPVRGAVITSLTRSGSTATAICDQPHRLTTGMAAVVSGAVQSAYNGRQVVTVTGPSSFTFTVAGNPVTPATGTILVAVGDTTDLVVMAGVQRVSSVTDVEFVFEQPDGTQTRGGDNALIQLVANLNDPLTLSAVLRGTSTLSPVLFAGTQVLLGNLGESAQYSSRAVPCAAGARVSVTFEALLPSSSGVQVELQTSTGSWQVVAVTTATPVGAGWTEYIYTVASFTAGGTTTRCRLALTGTAAGRPHVRKLRMVVI
jgi:hypothetical protein